MSQQFRKSVNIHEAAVRVLRPLVEAANVNRTDKPKLAAGKLSQLCGLETGFGTLVSSVIGPDGKLDLVVSPKRGDGLQSFSVTVPDLVEALYAVPV